MPEDRPKSQTFDWREVFSWLILTRAFQLAIRPSVLLVAVLAMIVTTAGWRLNFQIFSGSEDELLVRTEWRDGDKLEVPGPVAGLYADWPWQWQPLHIQEYSLNGLITGIKQYRPVQQLFGFTALLNSRGGASKSVIAYMLLNGMWALLVWSLAGGIITRIAVVRFTLDETVSLGQATKFAKRKWAAYFFAPLAPAIGICLLMVIILFFAWVSRIPYLGVLPMVMAWFVYLFVGFAVAWLGAGLLLGWPLMWNTISCEGTDSFDALGRSYGYMFSRPLHYLFYMLVSSILGVLGYFVVSWFAGTIHDTAFAATDLAGADEMVEQASQHPGISEFEFDSAQAGMLFGWAQCIKLIPPAFACAFFWASSAGIYLLLRKAEDQTDLDDVYLEEESQEFGLPPLSTEATGVPVVDETSPTEETPPSPPEDTKDND